MGLAVPALRTLTMIRILFPCIALMLSTQSALAAPFTECPAKAFLVQDTTARLYGVNLATGLTGEIAGDLGTTGKVNAVGFNFHDRYIYGWGYEWRTLVRFGEDFQLEQLPVSGLPDVDFFVGDVSLVDNIYYVYRKGVANGLYAVDLEPSSPAYLQAARVVDGATLNLNIFDLAFHPTESNAYSVNNNGFLYRIDAASGIATNLGDVGEAGTFGAVYFDADGWLYISRNSDGNIFRIDVDSAQPFAELFAFGPASGNNDGARCAIAPLVDPGEAIDFGDAPDSYGTLLANNGARHAIVSPALRLGSLLDGENDGVEPPLADDDDGIVFSTTLEVDRQALISVTSSGPGLVSGWVDFDQNGVFDPREQIISDRAVVAGDTSVVYDIPYWAQSGATWARFRLTTTAGVQPKGGVGDGEVEDYQVSITPTDVITTYYPSALGWTTLAYEDKWPGMGDFDMNDLVLRYRTATYHRGSQVLGTDIAGEIAAIGAGFRNGFAVALPGLLRAQLDSPSVQLSVNGVTRDSPIDTGQSAAVLVVTNDVWEEVEREPGCSFLRTEVGCVAEIESSFLLSIPFSNPLDAGQMPAPPFDPFIFATPGFDHGGFFSSPPGRGMEIHLKNMAPTANADQSYFGVADDASNPGMGLYYQTEDGLAWALEIATAWNHPYEGGDLLGAYPLFFDYVQSVATSSLDWYVANNATLESTYQ